MCPATTLELGLFVLLKMKKACKHLVYRLLHKFGNIPSGLDGTRTRDPLRDRQVF